MRTSKLLIALPAFFLLMSNNLFAQEQLPDSRVKGFQFYTEFGGPGVIFSANFDGRFCKNTALGFGYRFGIGYGISEEEVYYNYGYDYCYNYSYTETHSYATIPLGINYVFGKKTSPHTFEAGCGLTVLTRKVDLYNYDGYNPDNRGYFIGHFSFMYRRQPLDGGFTWRIGFTPIIGTAGDIYFSAAIGIGYAF